MSTQTYSHSFAYDRYGNRTQSANATLGLPAVLTSDYDTSNNNNRFVSSVASYDAAGNITTDAKFRALTYAYDANGRQKSASNGTWTQTQVYDGAGRRVQTSVGSTTRTMVYDAFGQNVAEYLGSTLERENIYRGGALLAIYEAATSALRYVLQDIQGSARAIVNSSGGIIARHDYLPFGEEIASGVGLRTTGQGFGATDPNRQKYGLTERDDTTGLDHTWWRKYENRSGRWTSPDPLRGTIGAPQSFNLYTYAANDPVHLVDPTGLDPEDPAPTTHIDPATGEPTLVPGVNGGVVTITAENSGLGMFGADANQTVAVIDRAFLNQSGGGKKPKIATLDPERLSACLDLFGVETPDWRRDQPFTYGLNGQGAFIVEDKKTKNIYAITTDFQSKTKAQLGGATGLTDLNKPRYNWVASDFAKDLNVERVAAQAAQIHEIGNSLGALTGRHPEAKSKALRAIDPDEGMALEECVFGGFVNPNGSVTK
jgi:RHS repeat-associated protein